MANRIRELRKNRGLTMKQLGEVVDLAESTISQYETGKRQPDNETLLRLGEFFGVTVGYLLGVEEVKTPILNEKDERDIAKTLETLMTQLDSGGDLMFDGDPISDEARDSIRSAMKLGLEAAKIKNKERFTPKKYRKG
jgi:transcriptional regulator with XRE-family HTH domain